MSKARELADLGSVTTRLDEVGNADGALSNRNLIINGAMQVAQRGTSTSGTTGSGYFAADRWDKGNISLGTWTVSQETDAPDGFSNSMKYLCTTAAASPAAGGYLTFRQRIKGQNTQHLKFGTSDAVNMTCSFWVKSNVTGTYTLALEHDRGGGENGKTYTINAADTWEYKTLTYSGQTTTAIPNDNAVGLELQFWLSTGPTYNSGTFTEDTYTTTSANRVSPNQANLASATSNYWQITGVQLEVGDTATPFEHRSYGDELARCQRYFQKFWHDASANGFTLSMLGTYWNATEHYCSLPLTTTMRANPSLLYSDVQVLRVFGNGTSNSSSNVGIDAVGATSLELNVSSSNTASSVFVRINNSDDWLALDAEL